MQVESEPATVAECFSDHWRTARRYARLVRPFRAQSDDGTWRTVTASSLLDRGRLRAGFELEDVVHVEHGRGRVHGTGQVLELPLPGAVEREVMWELLRWGPLRSGVPTPLAEDTTGGPTAETLDLIDDWRHRRRIAGQGWELATPNDERCSYLAADPDVIHQALARHWRTFDVVQADATEPTRGPFVGGST